MPKYILMCPFIWTCKCNLASSALQIKADYGHSLFSCWYGTWFASFSLIRPFVEIFFEKYMKSLSKEICIQWSWKYLFCKVILQSKCIVHNIAQQRLLQEKSMQKRNCNTSLHAIPNNVESCTLNGRFFVHSPKSHF